AGPYVINLVRIPGEQQVMLKVTVAEINRSAARSIGLNFNITSGGNSFGQRTGNIAGTVAGLGFGGAGAAGNQVFNSINQQANNLPMVINNGRAVLAINALKNLNYARTLAEPTLTTLDGHPAYFQAGGSFPVPILTGATQLGLQGVNFV